MHIFFAIVLWKAERSPKQRLSDLVRSMLPVVVAMYRVGSYESKEKIRAFCESLSQRLKKAHVSWAAVLGTRSLKRHLNDRSSELAVAISPTGTAVGDSDKLSSFGPRSTV